MFEFLRSQPYVRDLTWRARGGETPGWDIDYIDETGELVRVEVKGTTASAFVSIDITAGEWRAAQTHGWRYHLYLVADCTSTRPQIEIVKDFVDSVASGKFVFDPVVFRITSIAMAAVDSAAV